LFSVGSDIFYRYESQQKDLYILLPITFPSFIAHKFKAEILFVFFAGGSCITKSIFLQSDFIWTIGIAIAETAMLLFYNIYYASYFLKMKRRESVLELLAAFSFGVLCIIPLANVFIIFMLYRKGNMEWNKHVRGL
jgi:hypothetical protein